MSVLRSMRFSDDIIDMIEQQAGENFTKKFEMMVYQCFYALPEKQRQLDDVEKEIAKKLEELSNLKSKCISLSRTLSYASGLADDLSKSLVALKGKV